MAGWQLLRAGKAHMQTRKTVIVHGQVVEPCADGNDVAERLRKLVQLRAQVRKDL